jgi:hypothetical protein
MKNGISIECQLTVCIKKKKNSTLESMFTALTHGMHARRTHTIRFTCPLCRLLYSNCSLGQKSDFQGSFISSNRLFLPDVSKQAYSTRRCTQTSQGSLAITLKGRGKSVMEVWRTSFAYGLFIFIIFCVMFQKMHHNREKSLMMKMNYS